MDIVIWVLAGIGVLTALLFGVQYVNLLRGRQKRRKEEQKRALMADGAAKGYSDAYKEANKKQQRLEERIQQLEQYIRDNKLYVPNRRY